jgi:glutamate-1-semialdehyde 2,1-aminomutase
MEAGAAAVAYLRDHPEIYVDLETRAKRLADGVNEFCARAQIPAQMKHVGSMFHMFFQREQISSMRDVHVKQREAEKAFYLHCLNRGVLVPGTQRAFLSVAHTDAIIEALIEVFCTSLLDVQSEGLFKSP